MTVSAALALSKSFGKPKTVTPKAAEVVRNSRRLINICSLCAFLRPWSNLNVAIVFDDVNGASGRRFRFDVTHDRIAQCEVEWPGFLRFLENRISAAAEMEKIINRHDRVDPLRIDLLLVSTIVHQLTTQKLSAVLIVPLELDARAGLRVPYDDLKQLRKLHA